MFCLACSSGLIVPALTLDAPASSFLEDTCLLHPGGLFLACAKRRRGSGYLFQSAGDVVNGAVGQVLALAVVAFRGARVRGTHEAANGATRAPVLGFRPPVGNGSAACPSRRCRRVCAPAKARKPRCVASRRGLSQARRNPQGPGERHLCGITWRSGKIRQGRSAPSQDSDDYINRIW